MDWDRVTVEVEEEENLVSEHPVTVLGFGEVRKITGAQTQEKSKEDAPLDEYSESRVVHPLCALDDHHDDG